MAAVSTSVQKSSLTDIIQANAIGSNTCRISATTPPGRGVIFIEDGDVVDAAYGHLAGEDAFHALLNAEVTQTQVSTGAKTQNRRIRSGWQALIARAMTLRFEGRLPVPSFPDDGRETEAATVPSRANVPAVDPEPETSEPPDAAPAAPTTQGAPAPPVTPVAQPQPNPAPRSAPSPRRSPILPIAAALVLALALAGGAWLLRAGRAPSTAPSAAKPAAGPEAPTAAPVEATELTGEGDSIPALLSGSAPRSPNPESALVPTIVCRLLVAEDGSVKEASIFRSRLDQASFEDVALATVRTYRFHPGRRAGRPVAVWINWPVSFQ